MDASQSSVTAELVNKSTLHLPCHASQSSAGNVDSCQFYVSNERYVTSDDIEITVDWSTLEIAPVTDVTSDTIQTIVDWSTIEIAPLTDDDIVPLSEDTMCKVLGINLKDGNPRIVHPNPPICSPDVELLLVEAAIPVNDVIPEEIHIADEVGQTVVPTASPKQITPKDTTSTAKKIT